MKWFDRQFDFSVSTDQAETVCHRLRHTPARLQQLLARAQDITLNQKPGGKWSVKEHLGHLSILEPLWRIRFADIGENKEKLTPADLDNKATSTAGFNQYPLPALLDRFLKERTITLSMIGTLDMKDGSHTSLHPRLQQKMRYIDHAWFVAEHDDHHLNTIRELLQQL